MKTMGKIILKSGLPPLVGLIIVMSIAELFPDMSDKLFFIVLVVVFCVAQITISPFLPDVEDEKGTNES